MLSRAPEALTQQLKDATTCHPPNATAAAGAARSYLERQRPTALGPGLATSGLEATHLGPFVKHGPKGVADPRRWGASHECAEGGGVADEGGDEGGSHEVNDNNKKSSDERLLEIKDMVDGGDCELGDIREGYYVDFLRCGSAFRADIANKKEAAIKMTTVEHGNLSDWQRECVHLATQTEADMRSIHWYVDEAGGKVSQALSSH